MLNNQQKEIIPEINITQRQEQQQQQKNEQQKEEILEAGKRSERPEKNNEMPPLPAVTTTAPSKPKSFMPTAKSVMDARIAKKSWKKSQASKTIKWKDWKNECNWQTKTVIE